MEIKELKIMREKLERFNGEEVVVTLNRHQPFLAFRGTLFIYEENYTVKFKNVDCRFTINNVCDFKGGEILLNP